MTKQALSWGLLTFVSSVSRKSRIETCSVFYQQANYGMCIMGYFKGTHNRGKTLPNYKHMERIDYN
jgi:hypothetical protein